MRRVLIASAAILALCVPAFAATTKAAAAAEPKLAIPSFPGSKSVMELSMGEKDMLNWITQVLPAMATLSASSDPNSPLNYISKLDLPGLAQALQGLKQVRVVELALPKKPGTSAQSVVDYYTAQLEKEGGWTRIYWKSDDPKKALAVYSLPDAQGIFATSIKIDADGGKVMAGRTFGKVDLPKLIQWAAKNFEVIQAAKGK